MIEWPLILILMYTTYSSKVLTKRAVTFARLWKTKSMEHSITDKISDRDYTHRLRSEVVYRKENLEEIHCIPTHTSDGCYPSHSYQVEIFTVVRDEKLDSRHCSCHCVFSCTLGLPCCHIICCILAVNCGTVENDTGMLEKMKLRFGHIRIQDWLHRYWKRNNIEWNLALEQIMDNRLHAVSSSGPYSYINVPDTMEKSGQHLACLPTSEPFPTSQYCLSYNGSKTLLDRVYNMLKEMGTQASLLIKLILEKLVLHILQESVPVDVETSKYLLKGAFEQKHRGDELLAG